MSMAPIDGEVETAWEQSASIGAIAGALAKAQAEIKNAVKSAENPFFKSKYADLAEVVDACRVPLTKNEIAVVQGPLNRGKRCGVRTMLAHSSGEWMACTALATPKDEGPQSYGSVVSYLRRYSLASMAAVATEDDDGNDATHGKQIKGGAQPAKQVKAAPDALMANATQIQQIHILKEKIGGWTGKADHDKHPYRAALLAYKNVKGEPCTSSKELTFDQANNLMRRMQGTFDGQVANLAKMNGQNDLAASVEEREPGSDDDDDTGEVADAGLLQNVREAAKSAFGKKVTDLAPQWLQKNFGVDSSAALSKMQAERALQMLLRGDTL